ncbi:MAG: hypothetical protein PVG03_02135 [Desulfarculaceae bacterium]|jgi:hypothetical protein
MKDHFDIGSIVVIVITFIVFTVALFVKGFTHDLLLEMGVFLVSVKLIMLAHKNNVEGKKIRKELREIKQLIKA